MHKEIRVRFAPSPTGELHIGGLKTALYDYLFAQQSKGKFILRIEDTDQKRYVEGSINRLIESLDWAGLDYDEGAVLSSENAKESTVYSGVYEKGELGPYIQSERKNIYKKYIDQLVAEGKAYYCFCTPERLTEMRAEQQAKKEAPKYDRHCLELSKEEVSERIKKGENCVVRFKIPEGKTIYEDLVYGKVEVDNSTVDDQVILKSDGLPTYHLAVVVDDYFMKISHVLRGIEWMPSTPKHILLYEALGWKDSMPVFCHMPNILSKTKKKLSKREGSVSVEEFRKQGYPKQAIINFIVLLGWNPKTEQEIFTMDELIEKFDITKLNRAGGVFDLDRLDWISSQHIKKMSAEELYENVLPFLQEKEFYKTWSVEHESWSKSEKEAYIKKMLLVEKDRLKKFSQAGEENQFLFTNEISVSPDDLRWKDLSDAETKNNLEKALKVLENITEEEWQLDNIEKLLLEEAGDKRGNLLFPLRSALTGQKRSPSPFEVAWILGRTETLKRITSAEKIL